MRLSTKQRHFSRVFFEDFYPYAAKWARRNYYELQVRETWRTEAAARANAKKGVGIVNSNHRKMLAVDVLLWKGREPVWDSAVYEHLGAKWESLTFTVGKETMWCCWGGRFRRPDGGHFSFKHNGVK